MQEVKKIVVIGPESTGKSTLCDRLATHYNTLWCPEYAREYLLKHGTNYTYDDLLEIAKGQVALEREYLHKLNVGDGTLEDQNRAAKKDLLMVSGEDSVLDFRLSNTRHQMLFVDTDMYVMKVWCEFVFNNCHQYIIDKIIEERVDMYLLCNLDLPWVKDELREYPDLEFREKLYHIYRDIMINQPIKWVDIHGSNEQRTNLAIEAINDYFFTTAGV